MKFSELIQHLGGTGERWNSGVRLKSDGPVLGLTPRLREVRPGMAYFALPEADDADPCATQTACQRGASLVVCGPGVAIPSRTPAIRVQNPGAALAAAAAAFRNFPARQLQILPVTGDPSLRRGVAFVLAGILNALGVPTACLGGHGYLVAGRLGSTPLNRLNAAEVQGLLGQLVAAGGRCVVAEFDAAEFPAGLDGVHFSRPTSVSHPAVFRHSRPVMLSPRGSRVEFHEPTPGTIATTPLIGQRSLLALDLAWMEAVAVAKSLGHSPAAVRNTLPILPPIHGWLEPVQCGQPFGVFVDRATTAEELEAALRDARQLTTGKLSVICGPRATASRKDNAALGAVAIAFADHVWYTADNPRDRSIPALLAEMPGSGARPGRGVYVENDRSTALRRCIRSAQRGDVIVVAGKADAPFQEIDRTIIPFDDRVVAAQALHSRGYVGGRS